MTPDSWQTAGMFEQELQELDLALSATRSQCLEQLHNLAEIAIYAAHNDKTIFFCGNGGSAAESQHLAAELVVRYRRNRKGIRSIALTADTSILTACGNDISFDNIYARQVSTIGRPGDLLICLSTSGSSANILRAAKAARQTGMKTALLTSRRFRPNGESLYDLILAAPTESVSVAQVIHLTLGHILCDMIENSFCQEVSLSSE